MKNLIRTVLVTIAVAASTAAHAAPIEMKDPKNLALTARYDRAKLPAGSEVAFVGYIAERDVTKGPDGKDINFVSINNITAEMAKMMGRAFESDNAFFAFCPIERFAKLPVPGTKVRVVGTYDRELTVQAVMMRTGCRIEAVK